MKKLIIALVLIGAFITAEAQPCPNFPNTDSLRRYINRYIRNSAVEAFTNLRLNTVLNCVTYYLDSAYGGQVASYYKSNDSTLCIATLGGDTTCLSISGGSGTGITDGDKTDITVSGSGATFTIDNNAVTYAKIQQQVALSILGRSSNSTGNMAAITAGTDKFVLAREGPSLTFKLLDSSNVTGVHSEGYYNTKYALIGSGGLTAPSTENVYGTGSGVASEAAYSYNATLNRLAVDTTLQLKLHFAPFNGTYETIHNQQADTSVLGSRPYGMFSRFHDGGFRNEDGQIDYVDGYGYNIASNGTRRNTNESALWWATEGHYIAYPGANPQYEHYLQVIPKSGSGGYRIFGVDIDKITGDAQWYWRTASMQFFPSGSSVTPYLTMTPGSGIFSYSGTAPQLNITSTGGSPNSFFQILGTNDGSAVTNLTSSGGLGVNVAAGINAQSTGYVANHDYYFNSNHATSSGFVFGVLKQGTQKIAVAAAGQVGIGLNWLSGADVNYTGYQLQANGWTLLRNGLKAGGTVLDSSAIVDIESTTRGFLFPRMTAVERLAIASPAEGLCVYDLDTLDVMAYKGGAWYRVGGGTLGGAALASINGQNAASQLLTIGTAGLLPNWTTTGSNTNVLNIPMASTASVTAGLLSKSEYDALNSIYVGKVGGNVIGGGTTSGEDLWIYGSFSGNSAIKLWNGSTALQFDYPGVANTGRLYSSAKIQYVSTYTGGNQHEFVNQISSGFTGPAVVKIHTDGSTLGAGQDILLIEGDAGNVGHHFRSNGNQYASGLSGTGTPSFLIAHASDSALINLAAVPASMGGVPSGGTSGYVLTKNSGTSYDYSWTAPAGGGNFIKTDGNTTAVANSIFSLSTFNFTINQNSSGVFKLTGLPNATTGTVVVHLPDSSLGQAPLYPFYRNEVYTSSTSAATLFSYALTTGETVTFMIVVNAVETGNANEYTYGRKYVTVHYDGATATILSEVTPQTVTSSNGSTWSVDISGSNFRIRHTPGTASSMKWMYSVVPDNVIPDL